MTPTITICGLGPGGEGDLTEATVSAIAAADRVFLRTSKHPSAHRVTQAPNFVETFDAVYDGGESLAQVYQEIADRLVAEACDSQERVLYVVPGSPLVLERSVAHLRGDERINVELVPSLSFLDVAWARLGIDPVEERVRLLDGHVFESALGSDAGPLLVAHAHAKWVLSDIKLSLDAGPDQMVTVLKALGTDDEEIFEVSWPELDRSFEPDHLTSLYIKSINEPAGQELDRSVTLMAKLRAECPWDQRQTHESLRPFLLEEAYEVLEAIDDVVADDAADGTGYTNLEEELGDLWFQILFHAQLASEAGAFSIRDVAQAVHDKLVARHPHVFADVGVDSAEEVVSNWEAIKKQEKGRSSIMDGMPVALPALVLASKVLEKASRSEHGADLAAVRSVVDRGVGPASEAEEFGNVALALVELARRANIDLEHALRAAANSAADRFRGHEAGDSAAASPAGVDWVFG